MESNMENQMETGILWVHIGSNPCRASRSHCGAKESSSVFIFWIFTSPKPPRFGVVGVPTPAF